MSSTVFILGAGASAGSGAPVMGNFLDTAERIMTSGRDGEDREHFELVFKGLHELDRVYARSSIDTNNFESVFVAFEMAALLGRLGGLDSNEVEKLPTAMGRLIQRTLEETIEFPRDGNRVGPPNGYGEFAAFVNREVSESRGRVAVITFNYDVALDYALAFYGLPIDYALEPGMADSRKVEVLKLHGSLGWGRDAEGKLLAVSYKQIGLRAGWDPRDVMRSKQTLLNAFSATGRVNGPIEPVIVPPTWSKGEHHRKLPHVWRRAADCLRDAENIIICGFSLPPTDEFFRYLFALGTIGPTRLKAFWVCDAFPSKALDDRYRRLLGPKIESRYQMAKMSFYDVANNLQQQEGLNRLRTVIPHNAFPPSGRT